MQGNRLKSNKFIFAYIFLCVTCALYAGFSWISFVGIFVVLWLTWWKIYVLLDEIHYELSYFMTRNGLLWTNLRCRYAVFRLVDDCLLSLHRYFHKLVLTLTESVRFRQRAPDFITNYFNNTRLQRLSYLENNHNFDKVPLKPRNKHLLSAIREPERCSPMLGPISPISTSLSPYVTEDVSSFDKSLSLRESDSSLSTFHKRNIVKDRMMSDVRSPGFSYKFLRTAQVNGLNSSYGLSLASPSVNYQNKKALPVLKKDKSRMMGSGLPATVKIATVDELCDTSCFSQDVSSGGSPKLQSNLKNTQKLLEFLKEKSAKRSFQSEEIEIDQNAKRRKRETSGMVERGYHSDYNFSYPQKPLAPMLTNNKAHSGVKRGMQEDEGVRWNPSKLAKLSKHNEIMSTYSSLRGWSTGLNSKPTSPKVQEIQRVFAKKSDAMANLEFNQNTQDENNANLVNFNKERKIWKDTGNKVVKRNPMAVFSRVGKSNTQNPLRLLPDVMPSLEEFDLDKKREEAKLQKMLKAFRTGKDQGQNKSEDIAKDANIIVGTKEKYPPNQPSLQLDSIIKTSSPTASAAVAKADEGSTSTVFKNSSTTLTDKTIQDKIPCSVGSSHVAISASSSNVMNGIAASSSLTYAGVAPTPNKIIDDGSSSSKELTLVSSAATIPSSLSTITVTPVTSFNFPITPLSTPSIVPPTVGANIEKDKPLMVSVTSGGINAKDKSLTSSTDSVFGANSKTISASFPVFGRSSVTEMSSTSSPSSMTETRPILSLAQKDTQKESIGLQPQSSVQSTGQSNIQPNVSQSPFQLNVQASVQPSTVQSQSQSSIQPSTVQSLFQPNIPSSPSQSTFQSNAQLSTVQSPFEPRAQPSPAQSSFQSNIQPGTLQSPFQTNVQPSTVQSPFQSNVQPCTVQSPFQADVQPSTVQSPFQSNVQPSTVQSPFQSNVQPSTVQSPFQANVQPSTVQSPFQSNVQPSTIQSPFLSNIQPGTVQSPFQSNVQPSTAQSPFQSNIQPSTAQSPFQSNIQPSTAKLPFQTNVQPNTVQSPLQSCSQSNTVQSQHSIQSSLVQQSTVQPNAQQSATSFPAVTSFQTPGNTGTSVFSFVGAKSTAFGAAPVTKSSELSFGAAPSSDSKFNFSSPQTGNLFETPNPTLTMFPEASSFKVQNTFGNGSSPVPSLGTFPNVAGEADKKFSFSSSNSDTSFAFGKTDLPAAFNFGSPVTTFNSEGQSASTFGSSPMPPSGVFQFGSNNPPAGGFNFNPPTPSAGFNFSGNISSNFAFGQQGTPIFNTPPMGGSSFNIGTGSTKSRPGSKARKSKR